MKLDTIIRRTRRRLWLSCFARYAGACLFTALVIAVGVAAVDNILFLDVPVISIVLLMICLAMPAAMVLTVFRARADAATAALAIDSNLKLNDRVTSSVTFNRDDAWGAAIRADAEKLLSGFSARETAPFVVSWPARLIVPVAIVLCVVLTLPHADVLGRMQRKSQIEAETRSAALEVRRAVQAMQAKHGSSAGTDAIESVESLRLAIVRLERGELMADREKRVELGDKLRRLAKEITKNSELAKALERTADALERGDADARRMLDAVQAELARLEDALRDAPPQSIDWTAQNSAPTSRENELVAQPEALVETQVLGREPEADSSSGIIYSPRSTGVSEETGSALHDSSAQAAAIQIDSGRIPPGYVPLVRKYFDSIKPAGK